MCRGWGWGRGTRCSIQLSRDPGSLIKWLLHHPGPGNPALDYLSARREEGKEGGGHGAVAWIFYRPGLNMADFISEHTVHWPELVTRHTLVQRKLGNVVLLCLGEKWNSIWWTPSIVSATRRFLRSLLSTTVTSKGYMVPVYRSG